MRILIAGPGALGTVYAAALARAGHDVAVLARPERAAALRGAGGVFRVIGLLEAEAGVDVVTRGAEAGPVDYLILAVKTPDTQSALAALAGLEFTSDGAALSVQNGIIKDAHLAAAFGGHRVLGAASVVGAERTAPGQARCTLLGPTTVGELQRGEGRSARAERFAAACAAAGLPAQVSDDVVSVEWGKLCGYLPGALVTALSRRTYDEMLLDDDLRTVFLGVAGEVVAVARAEGATLQPAGSWFDPVAWADSPPEAVHASLRALGERQRAAGQHVRPSPLQDVLAERVTEVEDTAGDVVHRAQRRGLRVPVLETCYRLVRGLERGFGS